MRILQLFSRYQERGGEEEAVGLIGRHLRLRHDVEELYFENAAWNRLPLRSRLLLPFQFFWNPSACARFRAEIELRRPDIIIVHNLFPAGSAALLWLALKSGIPVIYYIHNFRPFSVNGYCWNGQAIEPAGLERNFWPEIWAGSWQHSRLKTALFAAVLTLLHGCGAWRRIPCWIAISEFMREKFAAAGVDPDRIHTLPYASEPAVGPQRVAVFPEDPHFLFLGRLIEAKGIFPLIKAWRMYCEGNGVGRLTIAGTGPLLEHLSKEIGIHDRIELAGQVSGREKESLLEGCTAVVVPSLWWEPFGLVVQEAYACGKPVLAAASGGLTELVQDGETGWIHEAGSPAQLCGQLRDAAMNPAEVARRGKNGRALLRDSATVDEWLDRFDGIAAPLVARTPVPGKHDM